MLSKVSRDYERPLDGDELQQLRRKLLADIDVARSSPEKVDHVAQEYLRQAREQGR